MFLPLQGHLCKGKQLINNCVSDQRKLVVSENDVQFPDPMSSQLKPKKPRSHIGPNAAWNRRTIINLRLGLRQTEEESPVVSI